MKKTFKRQSKTLNSTSKKRTMKAMKGGAKLATPSSGYGKPVGVPAWKPVGVPMKPVSGLVPQSFSKKNETELRQLEKNKKRKTNKQKQYEVSRKDYLNAAEQLKTETKSSLRNAAILLGLSKSTHFGKKAKSKEGPLKQIKSRIEELTSLRKSAEQASAQASEKAVANEATTRKVISTLWGKKRLGK
jgi:hypothetical protein